MKQFDAKNFNSEVFLQYLQRIPDTRKNELLNSGVLIQNQTLLQTLGAQAGGNYIVRPFTGLIGGDAVNYDGSTDITSESTTTYSQGVVVVGRAKGFTEKDFSYDITGGVDFIDNVAQQLIKYWQDIDQNTLLSILKGIFQVEDFARTHVYDDDLEINATTINKAVQQACGNLKNAFSLAILHSNVATQLENLQILEYLKYTDANGIQRNTQLATINGKLVLIDDTLPIVQVDAGEFTKTTDTEIALNKKYFIKKGNDYLKVVTPKKSEISTYFEKTRAPKLEYTSYVLGQGAFEYADVGAKTPIEMTRDASKNGGEETLYSRQRKVFAPIGFSFVIDNIASTSPTNAELEDGRNWKLIKDAKNNLDYPLKAIPIVAVKTQI